MLPVLLWRVLAALGARGLYLPIQTRRQTQQQQGEIADAIDDEQWRHASEEREAGQQQPEEHERAATEAKTRAGRVRDQQSEGAADAVGQIAERTRDLQAGQAGAGAEGEQQAAPAQHQPVELGLGFRLVFAKDEEGAGGERHRDQVGEHADQEQRQIGEPGAKSPGGIVDGALGPHEGPAGIVR